VKEHIEDILVGGRPMTKLEIANKEIKRLKEEYMILQNASDKVEEEKDNEIARLTAESTKWESKFYDEAKKVDKAIKYMEDNSKISLDDCVSIIKFYRELLSILKGSDKE
jgi:hypothetical protein